MPGRSAGIALEIAPLERPKNSDIEIHIWFFPTSNIYFFSWSWKKSLKKKLTKKSGNFKKSQDFPKFSYFDFLKKIHEIQHLMKISWKKKTSIAKKNILGIGNIFLTRNTHYGVTLTCILMALDHNGTLLDAKQNFRFGSPLDS